MRLPTNHTKEFNAVQTNYPSLSDIFRKLKWISGIINKVNRCNYIQYHLPDAKKLAKNAF